ncbi:hypothetical protein [Erythrobacter sp. JK5]|uniref:hypothetical protein n=1 Tax=Erythrobacter sp. JK5 TaxID=2829500 RepID=UPI001BA752E5|nr:hypothetical protein [Erythrobacter sp. JK5]QUL37034.1 hypothetical protein KDC96_11600 [Erythrobacter sp. JK5]
MTRLAFPICAALAVVGCATSADPSKSTLLATIDHHEWGDPSRLRVDLDSGQYSIEYGKWDRNAPSSRSGSRGKPIAGELGQGKIDTLNRLVFAAQEKGLVNQDCAAKPRNERESIVITNGGTPTLRVISDGAKLTAHKDLECWTEAANEIEKYLVELFDEERGLIAD